MDSAQLDFVTQYDKWNKKYRVSQNIATSWPLTSAQPPAHSLELIGAAPTYHTLVARAPTRVVTPPDDTNTDAAAADATEPAIDANTATLNVPDVAPVRRRRQHAESAKSIKAGDNTKSVQSVAKRPKNATVHTQTAIKNSVL